MIAQLKSLYRCLLKNAPVLGTDTMDRMGCPYFVSPPSGWGASSSKILIVGQEPFDWGFEPGLHYEWNHPHIWSLSDAVAYKDSVEALMQAYQTHNFDILSPYRVNAFEQANTMIRSFHQDNQIMTTNIFKCILQTGDSNDRSPLKGEPQELSKIMQWQSQTLQEEVGIVEPTAVIFFTGPNYDWAIEDEFKEIKMVKADLDYAPRLLSQLHHPALPMKTYRTYHPNYLRRSKQWGVVEKIAKMIAD